MKTWITIQRQSIWRTRRLAPFLFPLLLLGRPLAQQKLSRGEEAYVESDKKQQVKIYYIKNDGETDRTV